jgi:hypothetical protein
MAPTISTFSQHQLSNFDDQNPHACVPRPLKGWGWEINSEVSTISSFLKYGSFRQVTDYIDNCTDQYLITLTTRRSYDPITFSSEISNTMRRVNIGLFGTSYSRKKTLRLATFTIHERSFNEGLHAHMLVGVPNNSLNVKPFPCRTTAPDLILETWMSLDDVRKRNAKGQDAREISDFNGALGYVTKTINKLGDIEAVDVLNTTYPTSEKLPLLELG